MKEYWKKFFNLTVLEKNVDKVVEVVKSFGGKPDYKIYDIDGERIAHFSIIIAENGKKTMNKIIQTINSSL